MEEIQAAANAVVINIAAGALGLLSVYASYGVYGLAEKAKAQTALIKKEEAVITSSDARKKLEDAISDIERLVRIEVGAMEQTTAKDLRERVKNGQGSKSELNLLSTEVKAKIAHSISLETRKAIQKNFGSFDAYLSSLIEDRVLILKRGVHKGLDEKKG